MAVDDDHVVLLRRAGAAFARARKASDRARDAAREVAVTAIAAGVSEREVAIHLDVDRMTVRNWLGKR